MNVYCKLTEIPRQPHAAVTVGMFDGVHLGHQLLIDTVKQAAARNDGPATVVTFWPHPQHVLREAAADPVPLLTTLDEKKALFQAHGIERLIVLDFTETFAAMNAETFLIDMLLRKIGFRTIVVGYDHHFGQGGSGGLDMLRRFSQQHHFQVSVAPVAQFDGEVVSSTVIRQQISAGNVALAHDFLGRTYQLEGIVVHGDSRGRKLHFPTANIELADSNKLVPADGIYAVKVFRGQHEYLGALSSGTRPTFSGAGRSLEIYVLDFSGNLYGETLRFSFLKRLRSEQKFTSVAALVTQMKADVAQIRQEFDVKQTTILSNGTNLF